MPPEGWTPPSGLCECGCGKQTTIAKRSRPDHNEYTGHPKRWVWGHYGRALLAKRGTDHPRWGGGRYAARDGYVLIYKPDHPTAKKDGYIFEHRYVYEMTRGVLLPRNAIVHHINGIKDDNRPENLIVATRAHHSKVHIRASQFVALFLDDQLFEAARAHFRQTGELPDLEELTKTLHH